MKKNITRNLIIFACFYIANLTTVFAQTTVTVDEGLNTLSDALTANPGATLVLARGGSYVLDHTTSITAATQIECADTPANLPPAVISIYGDFGTINNGNDLLQTSANVTFKNIGFIGWTYDGLQQCGTMVKITSPNVSLVFDGCVVQGAFKVVETNGNNGLSLLFKNCTLFNLSCHSNFDNLGGFFTMWGNDAAFKVVNCTFFECGRIMNCGGLSQISSEIMDHNTYVNIYGDLYYPSMSKTFIASNNIYYNSNMRGYVGPRTASGYVGDFNGDFAGDSLEGDAAILETNEISRNIQVKSNLRYYDQRVIDNQLSAQMATLQPLLNDSVRRTFANHSDWVLKDNILFEEGNKVDPQFQMGALPAEAYTNAFLETVQRRLPPEQQTAGYPFSIVWYPINPTTTVNYTPGEFIWPLPFNLKPTNASLPLGSDGFPLGDLNWYGKAEVQQWESTNTGVQSILQNNEFELKASPNPFNNSISISYSVPTNARVTLKLYNVIGKEMMSVLNQVESQGNHQVSIDASNIQSGVYFCKIQIGNSVAVQKIMKSN